MSPAPTFDQSVEMTEAIRVAAIRLTREKKLSINRQASAMTDYINQAAIGVTLGVSEISQQIWSNFAREDSSHLPNNRAILDVAWRWLHESHEQTISEEVVHRRKAEAAKLKRSPRLWPLELMGWSMTDQADPIFSEGNEGFHTLLLADANEGFLSVSALIEPDERGSRFSFSLPHRTSDDKSVERHYSGATLPHARGLMIAATGPRGRYPAILLLRNAHEFDGPAGLVLCGTLSFCADDDAIVTQPCILIFHLNTHNLSREEISDELSRTSNMREIMADLLGRSHLII